MWAVMSNNREDLASSIAEGMERVRRGDYAFLMEPATISTSQTEIASWLRSADPSTTGDMDSRFPDVNNTPAKETVKKGVQDLQRCFQLLNEIGAAGHNASSARG
ncbi:hypothetical protein MTO96_032858 [Rhipicephalus appendiculatus]